MKIKTSSLFFIIWWFFYSYWRKEMNYRPHFSWEPIDSTVRLSFFKMAALVILSSVYMAAAFPITIAIHVVAAVFLIGLFLASVALYLLWAMLAISTGFVPDIKNLWQEYGRWLDEPTRLFRAAIAPLILIDAGQAVLHRNFLLQSKGWKFYLLQPLLILATVVSGLPVWATIALLVGIITFARFERKTGASILKLLDTAMTSLEKASEKASDALASFNRVEIFDDSADKKTDEHPPEE
jgi:hypothetical protein